MPGLPELENILKIAVPLVGILGVFIAVCRWGYNHWQQYRKQKLLEKNFGAELYQPVVIANATKYYIQPDCSSVDPTQEAEIRHVITARQKLFEVVNDYMAEESPHRHLLLLADSGMGKSSFILNYYVYNRHLPKSKRQRIAVVPLGIPRADEYIAKVENKKETVLFLDAFDEDTKAIDNHRKRLIGLMTACEGFKRVLITCRTQFFPREEEIPKETGIVKIGPRELGDKGYEFWKLYLLPFNDRQIEKYISKRYCFWQGDLKKQARDIIGKVELLSVRPMLLSYIPDLVGGTSNIKSASQVYEIMVAKWLEREKPWVKETESLRKFSEKLAFDLYINRQQRGAERIAKYEIAALAREWQIPLDEWKLTGCSLLNSDAHGNCKFAHRSIMEFLFVEYFLKLADDARPQLEWTDLMQQFVMEKIRSFKGQTRLPFSLYRVDLGLGDMVMIPKGPFLYGEGNNQIEKKIDHDYYT
jgi:hypothetical protein